jgi:hypothetical protein
VGAELLPWVFTSGWASGVNAYAVVLLLGLFGRFGHVAEVPASLERTDVLAAAAIMFAIELVADKIPYVDSAWDSIHTVVRPVIGAALAALLAGDAGTLGQALAAGVGGAAALASHSVKAGLRLAVNTSPEPASNVAVSAGEDLTVAGVISLAVVQPWLAAALAAVLLATGIALVLVLWRRVQLARRRWRERRDGRARVSASGGRAARTGAWIGGDPDRPTNPLEGRDVGASDSAGSDRRASSG